LQRAYDQIIHDVCLQKLPVVFAVDRAGIVGDDGPTHHGTFDISFLRHMPNLVMMVPRDENELQHMLKTAELCNRGPIAVRYPKGRGTGIKVDRRLESLEIGRGETLREGSDLVIMALGSMVGPSLKTAENLSSKGFEVGVVNARFVKPIDEKLILESARCGKVLTVEENAIQGGFGSAVLEVLEKNKMNNVKIRRLGIPDRFIEHGNTNLLRKKVGLDSKGIYEACLELLKK
jgi:1-deoxy-D-xylulose-5-phosphate synthase